MSQPLDVESSQQIHQRATNAAEPDHRNRLTDDRFRTALEMYLFINPVRSLAQFRPIEVDIASAIQEECSTELSGGARHGSGSVGDGQTIEQGPREARFHFSSTMSNHAQMWGKKGQVIANMGAVPGGDQRLCGTQTQPEICREFG